MKKISTWSAIICVLAVAFIISLVLVTTEPSPSEKPLSVTSDTSTPGASLTLVSPMSGTVEVGQKQTIRWVSSNYKSPFVGINLIRKVGDNPARYDLVRVIAEKTANDGTATWVPAPTTDVGEGLAIELVCVGDTPEGCRASRNATHEGGLAVINTGRFANTASAFQAIEQLENK